jgi:hypothetical protein
MSSLDALRKAEGDASVELELALSMCERANTPHSLAISMAIQYGMWKELKDMSPTPEHYLLDDTLVASQSTRCNGSSTRCLPFLSGLAQFKTDRQVSRMLVKSTLLDTGLDTKAEALKLFWDIEKQLENRDKLPPLRAPWLLSLSNQINDFLSRDGSHFLTPEVLEDILERGRLGPGSTATLSARKPQSEKLRYQTSYSPQLKPFLPLIKRGMWDMDQPEAEPVYGIEIKTVPKTAYIDRTVAAVPVADMFLQLGLASILEDRLRDQGINVRDQQRNANLASRASELKLATIDLSSASSWFSERNLEGILPPDLLHFVDLVRPHYVVDSVDTALKRPFYNWMPMGCGHTFNLMTLYFYALVCICVPKGARQYCSVYGDDIILPQTYAPLLIDRLEYLGFEVNRSKSFLNGEFFESCGTEWLAGHDVLPFYCRKKAVVDDEAGSTGLAIPYRVQLANKLRQWSTIKQDPHGALSCDKRWYSCWEALIKSVPKEMRPPVPYHLGDVGLITSLSESRLRPSERAEHSTWELVYDIKTLRKVQNVWENPDPFAYLLWLMSRRRAFEPSGSGIWTSAQTTRGFSTIGDADWVFMLETFVLNDSVPVFSYGVEPLRGSFGACQTKRVISRWPSGFEWVRS